jgi:hypothetical protein
MTSRYVVHINRVVVSGVSGAPPNGSDLRSGIEAALSAALADAPLPAGRSRRTAVQLQVPPLSTGRGLADAIGSAVALALRGGPSRG